MKLKTVVALKLLEGRVDSLEKLLNVEKLEWAADEKGKPDGMWDVRALWMSQTHCIFYGPTGSDFYGGIRDIGPYGHKSYLQNLCDDHNEIVAKLNAKIEALENQLR